MSQEKSLINLDDSLGYLLKQTAMALRLPMETVLRPLNMSITHYSCLELLSQRPGLSNSELARGTFVTRQSMNTLLRMLENEGCVERPESAPYGRILPTRITEKGRKQLQSASEAIKLIENQMLSDLDDEQRKEFYKILRCCINSLK